MHHYRNHTFKPQVMSIDPWSKIGLKKKKRWKDSKWQYQSLPIILCTKSMSAYSRNTIKTYVARPFFNLGLRSCEFQISVQEVNYVDWNNKKLLLITFPSKTAKV